MPRPIHNEQQPIAVQAIESIYVNDTLGRRLVWMMWTYKIFEFDIGDHGSQPVSDQKLTSVSFNQEDYVLLKNVTFT